MAGVQKTQGRCGCLEFYAYIIVSDAFVKYLWADGNWIFLFFEVFWVFLPPESYFDEKLVLVPTLTFITRRSCLCIPKNKTGPKRRQRKGDVRGGKA